MVACETDINTPKGVYSNYFAPINCLITTKVNGTFFEVPNCNHNCCYVF